MRSKAAREELMKIKNVFDTIFSDENLYGAIQDAANGRRYNKDVLIVTHDPWRFIRQIQEEVYSGTYEIERYFIFYVFEPKRRMIMSITFYHRIVQWAIYRVINPMLVNGYIEDSYGCIPGRGPLSAMKRVKGWVEAASRTGKVWYYLKLDISKYFYRVSHNVLKRILAKKIKDQRLLDLLYGIIECRHTPFGLPPGKSPGEVPMGERLYDVGMPIGNLLSQVFANVYLDVLDQYCKRVLQIHEYARYMDDVIIMHESKAQLKTWEGQIDQFLEKELELSLNKKTCIRPVNQGIEFVGYRIWPHYATLRKATTLKMKRKLRDRIEQYREYSITVEAVTGTLQCYIGMVMHCDCKRFAESMVKNVVLTHAPKGAEENAEDNCEAMVSGF